MTRTKRAKEKARVRKVKIKVKMGKAKIEAPHHLPDKEIADALEIAPQRALLVTKLATNLLVGLPLLEGRRLQDNCQSHLAVPI